MVVASIIIAARNADRFLEETLQSLTLQSLHDFEVRIVDDGSTDATRSIAARHATRDPRFIVMDGPARGVSAARNLGLTGAVGEWVLFLDADDTLVPDALDRFDRTLRDQPIAVAALGGISRMDEQGGPLGGADNRDLARGSAQLAALLRKNFIVNGGALAIRRAALQRSGPYDETLRYGEDWELWCRILSLGPVAVVEGARLMSYRQVGSGANYKARGDVFARSVDCIDRVADNPVIRLALGADPRAALRARRIDIFWSGVRSELQFGTKAKAAMIGLAGLVLYPDTVLRPGLALRFVRSLRQP